jgi:hypothetical protein
MIRIHYDDNGVMTLPAGARLVGVEALHVPTQRVPVWFVTARCGQAIGTVFGSNITRVEVL